MNARTLFIIGAIVIAALSRTLPHWANFAPISAMAIFGAATLRDRRLALLVPLLALFVSDVLITWRDWPGLRRPEWFLSLLCHHEPDRLGHEWLVSADAGGPQRVLLERASFLPR
jgi:hypothetical protein